MINFTDLTDTQRRALARLGTYEGQALREVLQLSMENAKDQLVKTADMVQVRRLQGEVEAFEKLLSVAHEAAQSEVRN